MWPAQTAPDPAALKDLSPAVAITFLVLVGLLALLTFFGGALRDRLRPPSPPDVPPPPATAPAAAATAATADAMTDRHIDWLERRVTDLERELARAERDATGLRDDNDDLRRALARRDRRDAY